MTKKGYELNLLLSPHFSEKELGDYIDQICLFIGEKAAIETKKEPKKIKLAYPVKKEKEAFLFEVFFKTEPEKLKEIEKKIKEEENVLRFIIISKSEFEFKPKIPVIQKEKILTKRREKISPPKKEKVELKEIDKKIEEILQE